MSEIFVNVNNFNTTLAAPITSAGQTTLQVASTLNLPVLEPGQQMELTLVDSATGTVFEVVYVTAISGNSLTVIRGQEGTAAQGAWNTGDHCYSNASAGELNDFAQLGGNLPFLPVPFALTPGTRYFVPFPQPFPNQLLGVIAGISTSLNVDPTHYGCHTDNETVNGFFITVTGGATDGSVSVNAWYIAGGK